MTKQDLINTLRQGVPVTARLVKKVREALEADQNLHAVLAESEQHRQILTRQNHELVAKNRELDQACRAMLAGNVDAYRMMRKALGVEG